MALLPADGGGLLGHKYSAVLAVDARGWVRRHGLWVATLGDELLSTGNYSFAACMPTVMATQLTAV